MKKIAFSAICMIDCGEFFPQTKTNGSVSHNLPNWENANKPRKTNKQKQLYCWLFVLQFHPDARNLHDGYVQTKLLQLWTDIFGPFSFWKQEETAQTSLEITRNSKY